MTFVPDPAVLLAYSLAAALLTLTPGPDMALYLGRTVAAGRAAGFAVFLGTAAGLVVHAGLAAVGLSALLAASATAFAALKVAGAAYLLWLAVVALRRGATFSLDAGDRRPAGFGRSFATGLLVNVLNPKIVVFFVTFLPQFVTPGDPHAAGKLFFLGLWYIAVTVPLTVPLILAAAAIARLLTTRRRLLRGLDYAFAAVMAAFAVRLVTARAG